MDIKKIENVQRGFTKAIFPKLMQLKIGKTTFTSFGDATINGGLNYLLQIAQWFN